MWEVLDAGFGGALTGAALGFLAAIIGGLIAFIKNRDRVHRLIIVGSLIGITVLIYPPTQLVKNGIVLKRSFEFIFDLKRGSSLAIDILVIEFLLLGLAALFLYAVTAPSKKSISNNDFSIDPIQNGEENNTQTSLQNANYQLNSLSDDELIGRITDYSSHNAIKSDDQIIIKRLVQKNNVSNLDSDDRLQLIKICESYLQKIQKTPEDKTNVKNEKSGDSFGSVMLILSIIGGVLLLVWIIST